MHFLVVLQTQTFKKQTNIIILYKELFIIIIIINYNNINNDINNNNNNMSYYYYYSCSCNLLVTEMNPVVLPVALLLFGALSTHIFTAESNKY